jgi:thiamine biosynthesis lipoprotein ApbE
VSYRLMPLSPLAFKRARPLLGTIVHLEVDGVSEALVDEAFSLCERLQGLFSLFEPQSWVRSYKPGSAGSEEGQTALELARRLALESAGAFVLNEENLDLTGIAKGLIVDRMAKLLERAGGRGAVNAGGDLRFFGAPPPYPLHVRTAAGLRALGSALPAIATSSLLESVENPDSSTRYRLPLRDGLTREHSVTVMASSAAVADGMTKVVMFGTPSLIEHCCRVFKTQVIVLDSASALSETFGAP